MPYGFVLVQVKVVFDHAFPLEGLGDEHEAIKHVHRFSDGVADLRPAFDSFEGLPGFGFGSDLK